MISVEPYLYVQLATRRKIGANLCGPYEDALAILIDDHQTTRCLRHAILRLSYADALQSLTFFRHSAGHHAENDEALQWD